MAVWKKSLVRSWERKFVGSSIVPSYPGTTSLTQQRSQRKEIEEEVLEARGLFEKEPENREALGRVVSGEYEFSKYVRMDNRAVYARYLGYLERPVVVPTGRPTFLERELLEGH